MSPKPYLSIVIGSRNDGYPNGNGLNLLKICTLDLIKNLEKIKKEFEILIVDYNTVKENPSLYDSIVFKHKNIKIKYIAVNNKFHSKLKYSKHFPVSQETALM